MPKDIDEWVRDIDAVFSQRVEVVMRLQQEGVTVGLYKPEANIVGAIPFCATFTFLGSVVTNIFFQLMDFQRQESDVVITNIKTLPPQARRKGFGLQAVRKILVWAAEHELHEVIATQVSSDENRNFWQKNGFSRCPDPNPSGDYVHYC